jgi:uncharacterized membrane protein YgcG
MQITTEQAKRIAHEALRQGIRDGNLIFDLEKRAAELVETVSKEAPADPNTPQWWVVYEGEGRILTAKAFGQDQQAAMDFAELDPWILWAVVHEIDWKGVKQDRIDRSPQSVRKAA